jgi:hypothetical protein
MTRFRSHLNACSGSPIYKRKKLAGERALPYEDLVALIIAARAEGAKRSRGADLVCALLSAIVRDSLPPNALPDVVVRPTNEPPPAVAPSRHDEELQLCLATSELITNVESSLSTGPLHVYQARELHTTLRKVERHAHLLVVAAERDGARDGREVI